MICNLSGIINKGETVAVALSGGSDSMALLHFLRASAEKIGFKVVALNVEHGIRGESSLNDTAFVTDYCNLNNIPLIKYSVDSLAKARAEKLSVEEAARALRYECFYDAIRQNKCDKVATAHHASDNAESVLLNILRGTGIKGVTGIAENVNNKIIRPFINVSKGEINEYVKENAIPFVTDESNFCNDYTRNYLRNNIMPLIKKVFPDAEQSISRFGSIAVKESDYLEEAAAAVLTECGDVIKIPVDTHPVILARATVVALKKMGVKKDWEKKHIDSVVRLATNETGAKVNLLDGVTVIKEYDAITFYREICNNDLKSIPFALGKLTLNGKCIIINPLQKIPADLKSGFFADADKIPKTAVIRFRKNGDQINKFGGKTKLLSDFFTELKIPLRLRGDIPLIADGKNVLAVFGYAVSENVKIDENTKSVIQLIYD